MLAPVSSLAGAQAAVPVLAGAGWLLWPDDPNRFYRLWFLRPRPQARTHHLYIMQDSHSELRNLLVFRDALRSDPALRQDYAALKDQLAERYRNDRDGYTAAKAEFVQTVLKRAGAAPSKRRPLN